MAYFTNTVTQTGFNGVLASLPALALYAVAVRQQRRALAKLDHAQLNDIGLTAKQARTEVKRPFWDIH